MEAAQHINEASLSFHDREGRYVGQIKIIAVRDGTLVKLSPSEAKEHGEEEVQLVEGCAYEYRVFEVPAGVRLRKDTGIAPSKLDPLTGRIETRNHTGRFPLTLEDTKGYPIATAAVEVRPTKLNYRDEYQQMLNDIGEKCGDLLLDMRTPMQARLLPTTGEDPETMQQRFAFLRSVLDSREFQEALQRLIAMPHRRMEAEETERDIRRGMRPSHQTLRQIASRNPRLPLPAAHPLAARMTGMGAGQPSVPAMLTVTRQRDTVDTPENRFVKHALTTYVDFFVRMEKALVDSGKETYKRLLTEVTRLREGLTEVLSRDLFRDVSEPTVLPLGSPVLQRKAGYREMLQAWLKFNLAACLAWDGGEDVFGAGKRDMAVLYEYWVFFQLLHLVQKKFDLRDSPSEQVFQRSEHGLGLRLKAGDRLDIQGDFPHERCPLQVRLSYNRTFSATELREGAGSWTRNMRPDYTLSFWPQGVKESDAERESRMVHLHFDAKYRADRIEDVLGGGNEGDEDLDQERIAQRAGVYKRADLLKMHAYRDAILRTEGAYVLYPGTEPQEWRLTQDAILPGIGAFALRPAREGEAFGMEKLSEWLTEVVEHLCERWSGE